MRREDVPHPTRPLYAVTDPVVRFESLVTAPNRVLLEELARTWLGRYAGDRFGARTGSAVLNDRADRSQHEVDVVALHRTCADGGRSGTR